MKRPDASMMNRKLRNLLNDYQEILDSIKNQSIYDCKQIKNLILQKYGVNDNPGFKEVAEGYIKELYENGRISHIVEVYEGTEIEYCGYLELYDEPNKVWFEGYYDNGKKLRIEKMNDKRGYQKEFDEEDQLIYICKRDGNGKLNGICYRYMNGGKITRISKWKDGKEVALIKLFNGNQMTEYKKGVKQYEGEFLDCLSYDYVRHGVGKEFDKDGKTVIYQGGYENGKRHGSGITYKNRKKDR